MDYHDVLAELGVGSAHPGGREITDLWKQKVPIAADWRVLDIGCGTGDTACRLAQQYGCQVTAVDIRSRMIERTIDRAKKMDVALEATVASAEQLPFTAASFDLVITESVNVFVTISKSLQESFRVLKPRGYYVDVEMVALMPVDIAWKAKVKHIYGARKVPHLAEWKRLYQEAGYSPIDVLMMRQVNPYDNSSSAGLVDEAWQTSSYEALQNPQVTAILRENAEWLEANHKTLGYIAVRCRKPV